MNANSHNSNEMHAEQFEKRLAQTFELDRLVRSHILYEAIALEGVVEQIIAVHFCHDESKHLLFQSFLFRGGEVSFRNKIRILKKLLTKSYPELYERVPRLIKKLDAIRDLRNRFAHSALVLDEEKLTKAGAEGVFLKSIEDGEETEKFFSKADANKFMEEMGQLRIFIVVLWFAVQKMTKGEDPSELLSILEDLNRVYPNIVKNETAR